MKLEGLSRRNWVKLRKYFKESMGRNESDREVIFDLIMEAYLTRTHSTCFYGFLHHMLKEAFNESFRKIPLLIGNSCTITYAVYKFRLDIGK